VTFVTRDRLRHSSRSAALGAAVASIVGTWLATGAAASNPDCIDVAAQAQYRNYGYDHIVRITNRCEQTATCNVSTNVNPEPSHVTVPSHEAVDVLTFRGSPSRVFTPKVDCMLTSGG
jgi:hypothetical protein